MNIIFIVEVEVGYGMSVAEAHFGDVAAIWDVKLADGNHKVVFEHGTTSGKRVISVDGVEVCVYVSMVP